MVIYLTQTMPQAGWEHTDQMGAGHMFRNGNVEIVLSQRYLLSRTIRGLTLKTER
jgi:hypothetical protein